MRKTRLTLAAIVFALTVVALLTVASSAFADSVTLLSNSTTSGASPAAHSTHSGSPGGTDLWTVSLTSVTGPAATRRHRLEESLDGGQNWTTVGLLRPPTWSITRSDCGAC